MIPAKRPCRFRNWFRNFRGTANRERPDYTASHRMADSTSSTQK